MSHELTENCKVLLRRSKKRHVANTPGGASLVEAESQLKDRKSKRHLRL